MIQAELKGITIQTAWGPLTLLTEMPIIPTPIGPIMVKKAKEEVVPPIVAPAVPTVINMLPIILLGIGAIAIIILIAKRR